VDGTGAAEREAAESVLDDAMRRLVLRTGEVELTVGAALTATTALRAAADRKLVELVGLARESGASWAAIAEALGVSAQAAHQRFGPGGTATLRAESGASVDGH
jgi:hypothetical protein